jgi:hypothetical protein
MSRRACKYTQAEIPIGHVYFILAPKAEAMKIGYSKNPMARFSNLDTGSPEELVFWGSIPGSREDETALHNKFKHLRLGGEWFRECGELLNHIEDLADDNWELNTLIFDSNGAWP